MHRVLAVVRRPLQALVAALLVTAAATSVAAAAPAPAGVDRWVEILPIEGLLDPALAGAVTDVVAGAEARGAELVVIQMSSPGAVSTDVAALATTVADTTVPVVVYVGPAGAQATAAGGAALLLFAADVAAMAPDATVGPLVPVRLGDPAAADATSLRTAAGSSGQDLPRDVGDGTTAARLLDAGHLDLVVPGLNPLLVELDGVTVTTAAGERTLRLRSDEVSVRYHSLGLLRRMLHAATTAPFIYLLFTVGLALLAFELFQPGFGVAGVAGAVMAAIGVVGLWILPTQWWAVALIVAGLGLFTLDAALAGFGAVTVAATAAFAAGSWWLYGAPALALPWWLVAGTTLVAVVFFVLVITVVLRAQAGPEGVEVSDLVGRAGIVRSVLNPEGHVYIDGALWRARSAGTAARVKVGTAVQVRGVDGAVLLVDRFQA